MRRMTRGELDTVVGWAVAEGWDPGKTDADAFFAADPGGFFVGELDGELVASISLVRFADGRAFLGFYIVRPEHRGRGYGIALWEHARAEVVSPSTGLDGVVAQIANYERSGFVFAHRTIRFSALSPRRGGDAPGVQVVELDPTDLDALIEYDAGVFGCARSALLRPWVLRAHARTVVAFTDGAIVGYGTIRPSAGGQRIGPVFADSAAVAGAVVDALTANEDDAMPVAIDVPDVNTAAVAAALDRGMAPLFETARMVDGIDQGVDWSRVFGVTSLELG